MQMREKVGKSRNTLFFQWFGAPEGRKVGSLKRRVPSHLARWEMKNCTPLWREAHFEVKMYKTHHVRTTFGSWDVEKVHAVVARSTFRSQNVQSTLGPDHFWQLRCRKSARRCGAKHISKSKCTKRSGPLLAVEMSKKCTPLGREAHFEVKMYETQHVRTTFGGSDVEKVHAVVARGTFRCQNVKTRGFGPLLEVQMSKKCTPLWREAHFEVKMLKTPGFGPLLEVQMSLRVAGARDCAPCQKWAKREGFVAFSTTTTTTPHYTPIHYTQLHSITLHYITLHYTPLRYTTLHYTTLPSTTLHYTTRHYITLHYTTLHYTTLHYTTLHYTALHYTTLHYTSLHYTTLHSTTLQLQLHNYTPLHSTTPNTLHYITLHHTTFHYTALRYTTLHYTTRHYLALHFTALHYTTLHYLALHFTTLHYTTLHYAKYTTLHYITPHYISLHYTTLHYATLHWMTLHHR